MIDCPFCGSDDHVPHIYEEYSWVTVSVVRCQNCGHRFANPAPIHEFAVKHYNSGYLKQPGTLLPRSLDSLDDPDSLWSTKMWRYEYTMSLLPDLGPNPKIFDVGCSWGGLMFAASRHYDTPRLTGCDIAKPAIDFVTGAFGFEGFVGIVGEFADFRPDAKFDLVLTSHSLEHSLCPKADVQTMAEMLVPGGYLFVTLPNHDSYLRKKMGGFSPAIRGGNHYQFFGEEFLCQALVTAGLKMEWSFSSTLVSPYLDLLLSKLEEDKDSRSALDDPREAVDMDGEGEFLYLLASRN